MWRAAGLLIVVIAVLIGAGRWLAQRHERAAGDNRPAVTTPDNSDYYLQDATAYQLTPQGGLAYRTHAVQALHFPDGSARLTDVDVHYVKGGDGFWDLHANKGHVPAGQRDIYLYDGVTGRHPRDSGQVVRFATTHAWVHPDTHLVDSDAHVKAFQPGQTLTGDGMRLDLATNKLNLLDNVHVTYDQ